jgi:hypothetical protein
MPSIARAGLLLSFIAASALASPASAGCHLVDCVENVYVQPEELDGTDCGTLWTLRNSIYNDAGYCFKTERAKEFFINEGCTIEDIDAVPLNEFQRHNIEVIAAAEKKSNCTAQPPHS